VARILYIWQKDFPWDVRVEKICCALRDAGHEVLILARWEAQYNRPKREMWQDIQIVRVGYKQPSAIGLPLTGNPCWSQAIRTAVQEFKPHLLIPREIMLAEAAAWAAHSRRIPVVIDMAEHYPAAMRGWKKYTSTPLARFVVSTARIPDWVERRAVRRADGIITVCAENSERLQAQYAYPLANTAVVHNTPTHSMFADVQASPHPKEFIRHFGYHGVLSGGRGLETLVQAFALVRERIDDARLTIAGDGESLPDLRQQTSALSLQEYVSFTGRYAPSELGALYRATDVAVIPHPTTDFMNTTLPNKAFDYMACGIPIVSADVRPMRRLLSATQAGIIADCSRPEPLAESLVKICQMPLAEYRSLSRNGRQAFTDRYNWDVDKAVLLAFVERFI
jgi:glycosyltransferase involved in cell wall biosynthesis